MMDPNSPQPGTPPPRQPTFLPPAVRSAQLPSVAQPDEYASPGGTSTGLSRPTVGNTAIGHVQPQITSDEDHWTEALQDAPPWLGSLVLHMLVLIIMGLMVVSLNNKKETPIQAVYSDTDQPGEQLLEDNREGLATDTPDPTIDKTEFSPTNLPPVADPLAAPPLATDLTSQHGLFASSSKAIDAPIGLALTGRERGMKKALLGRYGGNATTEEAVHGALEWLKRNQRANGYWTLNGPYSDPGEAENKTSATAMALLAFQGAGYTHLFNGDYKYDYKQVVKKGWDALLKMQTSAGQFVIENSPVYHQLYSHAQATIALCELYGMTHDSSYRGAAERAVKFCVKMQDGAGGWRYNPGSDSDTSVTGWYVMALQSAMMAGLEVPSSTMLNISRYLDSAQDETGSHYMYQPHGFSTHAMTAEGLLCREYLGWKRDDPRLLAGAEFLANNSIDGTNINAYYWYYATQVLHHLGGDYWKHWNEVMRQVIPETQVKKGAEEGSWDPTSDKYGGQGGRLYVTCMRTFMLEVYYRHLPIYDNIYDLRASKPESTEVSTDTTTDSKEKASDSKEKMPDSAATKMEN
jgi:hypothetical protein